jgi:hypothetical protein
MRFLLALHFMDDHLGSSNMIVILQYEMSSGSNNLFYCVKYMLMCASSCRLSYFMWCLLRN